ncbi:hypothetical protein WJX72_010881 [[Myrmecia] bisecta]|uniref:Uncharacterized protein n=1 Tax=[Myrmecia] bisecta TaxID=41462 RepID=A0AAW1QAW6_9CHLO
MTCPDQECPDAETHLWVAVVQSSSDVRKVLQAVKNLDNTDLSCLETSLDVYKAIRYRDKSNLVALYIKRCSSSWEDAGDAREVAARVTEVLTKAGSGLTVFQYEPGIHKYLLGYDEEVLDLNLLLKAAAEPPSPAREAESLQTWGGANGGVMDMLMDAKKAPRCPHPATDAMEEDAEPCLSCQEDEPSGLTALLYPPGKAFDVSTFACVSPWLAPVQLCQYARYHDDFRSIPKEPVKLQHACLCACPGDILAFV